jgi:hypothetical protein
MNLTPLGKGSLSASPRLARLGRSFGVVLLAWVHVLFVSRGLAEQPNVSSSPPELVTEIANCLAWASDPSKNNEVVLLPSGLKCVSAGEGRRLLTEQGLPPKDFVMGEFCRQKDKRHLPSAIIKQLVEAKYRIQLSGIRIFGAVFCSDELDLNDIDLPYSLVLDFSVFRFGISAREFKTRGKLSVDNSFVFDNLTLLRAKIDESIFARHSMVENLVVIDSSVGDSVHLEDSVFHTTTEFRRTTVQSHLNVTGSALSSFVFENGKILGKLDLRNSEVRCEYQIRNNELGELLAENFGFGSVAVDPSPSRSGPAYLYSWRRSGKNEKISNLLANSEVNQRVTKAEGCGTQRDSPRAAFVFSQNKIGSLCLHLVEWLLPVGSLQGPTTLLSLSGTKASGDLIIDLWHENSGDHDKIPAENHVFEAVGLDAHALVFNFDDSSHPYTTFVDALQFDHVHAARGACRYEPTKGQWTLPPAKQIVRWLRRNNASSLQPFVAFAKAFVNDGADETDLKVAKAEIEFETIKEQKHEELIKAWTSKSFVNFIWEDGFHFALDYLRLAATWSLGWIADFGYRPVRVIWSVIAIIILFWLIFWVGLGIVAFKPEKKNTVRIIGFTFLFDRLIPVYKIREDNYDISTYYKRGQAVPPETVPYFRRSIQIRAANDQEARRAEICLDILKAIGIVLAVFLAAAINALVAH